MNHRTAQHNFKMAYYRCTGPTTINNRTSWGPMSTPHVDTKYDRPLSGNFDRIINAFERTNAFEYVRNTFEASDKTDFGRIIEKEERFIGHGDIVVNRKMSSSYERADSNLAAQTPCSEEEVAEYYREKILYSQARQLFPLQEDLADWINKTIGISYLTGENFLDVIDNGVELCQLATVIHDKAQELKKEGMIVGKVPKIKGRCWQRAARRSFFSRDNAENFITFCRELGVHENLLFESDDLVLHNQPRQVILCLLELARIATKFDVEPPGLVQLEKEIAMEERDSGLDSAMSGVGWQFREASNLDEKSKADPPPSPEEVNDNVDNESTPSVASNESDVPLKPTNELDKRVQLVTRLMERGCSCGAGKCSKLLKVKKVGEGRYNIAGRNVFIRLLKGRHMMVRVGGGWDTLEHFLSRHEPCQVRLVTPARRHDPLTSPSPRTDIDITKFSPILKSPPSSKTSSISGNISPVDSKSSFSGTISPVEKLSSRKSTPTDTKSPNMSPQTTIDRKINGSMTDVRANGLTTPVKQRSNGLKSPKNRKNSGSISPVSCKSIGSTSSKRSSTASPIDCKTSSKGSEIDVNRAPSASPISKNKNNPKSTAIRKNSGSVSPTSPKVNGVTSPLGQRPNSMNSIHRQSGQYSSPNSRANSVSGSLRRTSTPVRPRPTSLNTSTPTGRPMRTPEKPMIKKESRSLSLMSVPKADDKKFCGTDRLNAAARNKSTSLASTPTEPKVYMKKFRSHSLASTPSTFCKPISLDLKGMSQADIEESIRISLQNKLLESSTQPFLHIKAKYRSPPPREVPPR